MKLATFTAPVTMHAHSEIVRSQLHAWASASRLLSAAASSSLRSPRVSSADSIRPHSSHLGCDFAVN
eukprot:5119704-Pleurochrysis_carterae.AAC.3